MNIFSIFQEIEQFDPEVYERFDSRRAAFKNMASLGTKALAAAAPIALGTMFKKAYGQTTTSVNDVLNYALTLEYLEDEFYAKGLAAAGLIPADRRAIFQQISKHEAAHVALLKGALGSAAVAKPTFDFTAGKGKGGGAYADVFTNYTTFLALSQAFEDAGVRAYKGQAANLMSNKDVLTIALQIHSVEARHAALVRKLRGQQGWINGSDASGLPAAIYGGEENVSQGGVDVTTLGYSSAIVSQAFDEPLTRDQVLSVATLFVV